MTKVKWKVQIPPPNAKRMTGSGVLVVRRDTGWSGSFSDKYQLPADATEAVFEVAECYEWIGTTSIIDGDNFDVYVEYTNSTGSRKSSARLVPEKVGA